MRGFLLVVLCFRHGRTLHENSMADVGCKWGPIPLSFTIPYDGADFVASDLYGLRGYTTFKMDMLPGARHYCIIAVESASRNTPALKHLGAPCEPVPDLQTGGRCVIEGFAYHGMELSITPHASLGQVEHRSECRVIRLDVACRKEEIKRCAASGRMPSSHDLSGMFQYPGYSSSWTTIWQTKVPDKTHIILARVSYEWPNFRLLLVFKESHATDSQDLTIGATYVFGHGQMSQTMYRHIGAGEYYLKLQARFCGPFELNVAYDSHSEDKTFASLSSTTPGRSYFFGPPPVLCSGSQLINRWDQRPQAATLKIADVFEIQSFTSVVHLGITEPSLLRIRVAHHSGPIGPFRLRLLRLPRSELVQTSVSFPLASQTHMLAAELTHAGTYQLLLELLAVPLGALHTCRTARIRFVIDAVRVMGAWPGVPCGGPMANALMSDELRREVDVFTPEWKETQTTLTHGGLGGLATVATSNDAVSRVDNVLRIAVQSDFLRAGLVLAIKDLDGMPVSSPSDEDNGSYDFINRCRRCQLTLFAASFQTTRQDCVTYGLDITHFSENDDPCRAQLPDLPESVTLQSGDARIMGTFVLPRDTKGATISVPSNSLLLAHGTADGHVVFFHRGGSVCGTGQCVSDNGDELRVQVTSNVARVQPGCVHLNLFLYAVPPELLPICPWRDAVVGSSHPLSEVDNVRHFQLNMTTALGAWDGRVRSAEIYVQYQSNRVQSAIKRTHFSVPPGGALFRLEARLHPPFIPLVVTLRHGGAGDDLWGSAERRGSRLLLSEAHLPWLADGYNLDFSFWATQTIDDDKLRASCAHLRVSIVILRHQPIAKWRQELLDYPELQAVIPLSHFALNPLRQEEVHVSATVTIPSTSLVKTYGTALNESSVNALNEIKLVAATPLLMRMQAEPMYLEEFRLYVSGTFVPGEDAVLLPAAMFRVPIGNHVLRFRHEGSEEAPFHLDIALGLAQQVRAAAGCANRMQTKFRDSPDANMFSPPVKIRTYYAKHAISQTEQKVVVTAPSILHFSAFSHDWLRFPIQMGLRAHAGFWTGEQRLTKNTLTIELSPGTYRLVLKHPSSPVYFHPCGTFTVIISLTPVDASTFTIASRCHPAFGAGFLPIDASALDEGSTIFGGPINFGAKYGSVLRGSAIITDLHDGRKKSYLSIPLDVVGAERGKILLKVSTHGDRLLTLTVQETEGRIIDPVAAFTQRNVALFELILGGRYWISFHREHRMRAISSCERINFFLALATHTAAADVLRPFCAQYADDQNSLRGGVQYVKNRVTDTVEIPLDRRAGAYHVFRAAFSFVHSDVTLVAVTRNATYVSTLQFAHVDSGRDGPPLTAAQVVVVPSGGLGKVVVHLTHNTMFGVQCAPVHFSHRVVTRGPILPLESFPVPPEVDFSLIGVDTHPSVGDSKAPIEHNPISDIKLWTWDSARFSPSLLTSGTPFRVEDATYRRAHLHDAAPRPFEEDDGQYINLCYWRGVFFGNLCALLFFLGSAAYTTPVYDFFTVHM